MDDYFVIESEILNDFGLDSPHQFIKRARDLDALFSAAQDDR